MTERRFPPPRSVEQLNDACFIVKDTAEQPQLLTAGQRTRWEAWRRDRLLATGDVPWLTVADAVAELKELSEVAPANQRQLLGDIRNFLRGLKANLQSNEFKAC